jgi:hypothetical protein
LTENLPEPIIRHHNLKVNDTRVEDAIYSFCTVGLQMPRDLIEMWWPAPNIDGYYVLTTGKAQFLISGPSLVDWEWRQGRDDCIYD